MSPELKRRLLVIAFCSGLNIVLGHQFWKMNYGKLAWLGGPTIQVPSDVPIVVDIDQTELLNLINGTRVSDSKPELTLSPELTKAAESLLAEFAKVNYQIENQDFQKPLRDSVQKTGYRYEEISDVAIIGPSNAREVYKAWFESENQKDSLLDENYSQTGIATATAELDGFKVGVVVQILAKPTRSQKISTKPQMPPQAPETIREIPDEEVVQALNSYRAAHGVLPLRIDDFLCTYATKRTQDLVAHGSLDGHAGFKADFEKDELPVGLRDYDGHIFGENLASQYCINGTTKEPFQASSGTALIEWCFDSSQTGHREAQLSSQYDSVCVRHAQNMYVVIFAN